MDLYKKQKETRRRIMYITQEEAELKAYKKNASRTIQKIEPYFKKGREYVN